jgi:hypothetical protein
MEHDLQMANVTGKHWQDEKQNSALSVEREFEVQLGFLRLVSKRLKHPSTQTAMSILIGLRICQ